MQNFQPALSSSLSHSHLYDYEPGDFREASRIKERERLRKRKLAKGAKKSKKGPKTQAPTEDPGT